MSQPVSDLNQEGRTSQVRVNSREKKGERILHHLRRDCICRSSTLAVIGYLQGKYSARWIGIENWIFKETVSPEQSSGSSVTKTAVMPKNGLKSKMDLYSTLTHSFFIRLKEGARGMSEREISGILPERKFDC